jgi:hypothetical protein
MDVPWLALRPVEKDREYLALLSFLPVNRYSRIPLFMRSTFQIQRQLKGTAGVIGYSLRAEIFSRRFWTLSVWEDSAPLMDFVARVPHSESMKAMAPFMGKAKFTQWKILGSAVPLRWDEAVARMEQGS